jgi:Chlamydia polymorphic membrane protein (Chlamydia_PMP) repeat
MDCPPDYLGGGIYNDHATLTLSSCTISGNSTEYGGGGIYNGYSGPATLAIINSTFSGNSASYGGGIFNDSGGTITNSTFSGNSAGGYSNTFDGLGGGIWNTQTFRVTNTTFSGNSATIHGGGICKGGNYSDPILKIGDTILNAGPSGENIHNESGTTISLGYNLSSDNGGGYLTATSDRINTHPRLGPLQNNGGPTFPQLPASNSPAIDAGDPTLGGDQRGSDFVRVMNCRIDIGAVEVQATPTPTPMPTPTPTPHGHGRH